MKLSDYLVTHQLSPADFAEQIGVTPVSVTRYLAGTRRPEWQILVRIAKTTDGQVTADDFMIESPPPKRGNGRRSHEAVAA